MANSDHAEDDHGNIVIFRDPDVEFVFGQIGNVTRQRGRIVVHRFAGQDPAHVCPPLAVAGRMGIAFLIGVLMMDAMRGHPENRPTFKRQRGASGQRNTQPLSGSYIRDG